VTCDVTDEDDVKRAADVVAKELGGMHVAIANAGFSVAGKLENLSAEDWRRQLDTNVVGAAMTCRYSLPHLRETKGRIALVGSVAAFTPAPKIGAYCASKAAVRAMGLSFAIELHGTGVSCSVIHPGYVESEIAQVDNSGRHDAARVDKRPKNLMWPADRAARVMASAIWSRSASCCCRSSRRW
jgi:NAD(P)-dependent dehydrogenase (short-subunit alcohol dehydrogenase family)